MTTTGAAAQPLEQVNWADDEALRLMAFGAAISYLSAKPEKPALTEVIENIMLRMRDEMHAAHLATVQELAARVKELEAEVDELREEICTLGG